MADLKHFAEWYLKSRWVRKPETGWCNMDSRKEITTDELLAIYESETRKYSIGEVWETTPECGGLEWKSWGYAVQARLTAFAERYHQLKSEGRIKP